MDVTPQQLIGDVEFQQVRRGYDPAEVDAFLDRIEAAMGKLQQQLVEATARAQAAEARLAEQPPGAAPGEGSDADQASIEQLQRTLVLAQRTADAAVKEAQEEADALRAGAQSESAQIVAKARSTAESEAAAAREASLAELRELETVRDSLHADIELLQGHVEAHRTRIGSSIGELQRLIDDPDALRVVRPDGLSGVSVPATEAVPEPAAVEAAPVAEAEPAPEVAPEAAEVEALPAVEAQGPEQGQLAVDDAVEADADDDDASPAEVWDEPAVVHVDGPPPAVPVDELIDLDLPVHIDAPAVPKVGPARDGGPPTQAIDLSELDLATAPDAPADADDAFLAELRKAMTDDEPLGPRDDDPISRFPLDEQDNRPRPRFGRRR